MSIENEDPHGMNLLQADVLSWAQQTFPRSTVDATCKHLAKEAAEIAAAYLADEGRERLAEECGDVLLILLHVSARMGIDWYDLLDAATAKLEVNKVRQWGQPDADGVVEHVR